MTPLERRYRRTLRLLPAGYRQRWEEDMVGAYMESASHDAASRRSRAEHLSVLGLAVRLRLSGTHASPRGLAWRGAVNGFALVALLYLALSGIVTVTTLVVGSRFAGFNPSTTSAYLRYWSGAVPAPLWVAAFVAVVLGRAAAARVLVLLAFSAEISVIVNGLLTNVRPYVQLNASAPDISLVWRQAVELSVANGLWFAVVTVATLISGSSRAERGRWFWLGGGALLALVLVAAEVIEAPLHPVYLETHVNLGVAVHLGLLAAMAAALAVRRNPRWLLALALFVIVFGGGELLDYVRYILDGRSVGQEYFSPLSYMQRFDVGLMAFAVACAVVGFIGLRRLPRVELSATDG
jgi:hypothetical protein